MALYNRIIQLAVGAPGQESLVLDGLRVVFNITRTEDAEPNDFELEVYNLSASSRAKFEDTENRVILQAGYASSGLKLLATGDIMRASSLVDPPLVTTKIEARDGGRALRDARASVSFQKGVDAQTILNALVEKLNVDGVEVSADLSGTFKQGWSFIGSVQDGISKLARQFSFDWSVQNNTIQVTTRRTATQRGPIRLSASTGMIGSPSRLDRTDSNRQKDKDSPGFRVDSLLNPALIPGDPVIIESQLLEGKSFRISKVVHRGDTHGPSWNTQLEIREPGSSNSEEKAA
jgi:hypothetical protein